MWLNPLQDFEIMRGGWTIYVFARLPFFRHLKTRIPAYMKQQLEPIMDVLTASSLITGPIVESVFRSVMLKERVECAKKAFVHDDISLEDVHVKRLSTRGKTINIQLRGFSLCVMEEELLEEEDVLGMTINQDQIVTFQWSGWGGTIANKRVAELQSIIFNS